MDKASELLRIAETILTQTKLLQQPEEEVARLAAMKPEALKGLETDNVKKAFWINIYNSFFLLLAKKGISRKDLFSARAIDIAGILWTLDEIEHGILRKNKIKISFGYLSNPFGKRRFKQYMLQKQDFRIHFALNCGVKGCPPIAFYAHDKIDQQLELATASFLELDSILDHENKIMRVSRLFYWYHADFGGSKGIRKIHSQHLETDFARYTIKFRSYDFTEALDNFADF